MSIDIILVDDDQALRRATRQTLELAGYAVRDFGAAPQALAQLSRESEAVVVTDIRMAGMDGLELFARLRSLDPDLPVLLITGHGDVDMAVRALHDGAYDFIAKPFPADRLVQSVARATEKRRRRKRGKMEVAGWSSKTAACERRPPPRPTTCPSSVRRRPWSICARRCARSRIPMSTC